jgi:SAM-dependent methyltransferase
MRYTSGMHTTWLAVIGTLVAGCGDRQPAAKPDGTHSDHYHRDFTRADDYVAMFDDPARDAWQKPGQVVALLEISPGMTIADVGAGTGYFLPHLSRATGEGGAVLALDIEPDMVRHMTERAAKAGLANVEARVVEPADPKLGAGSVDRILIVNTWHHIGGRKRYAARLREALRPGGLVAVVDYTREAPRGPPPAHRLPAAAVVSELEAGGLRAEIVAEDLPHQYVVIGRRD